ncbi:MAG: hypothetical protein JXA21_20695 [Anaerolineae bacterium]|nr:hypothetical protein [Anaerolineae bacterium]
MKTLKNGDSQPITPESASHIKQAYQVFFFVATYKLLSALLSIILGGFDSHRIVQIVVGLILLGLGFALRANGRVNLKSAMVVAISALFIEATFLISYATRQEISESGMADFWTALVIAITSPRVFFNSVSPLLVIIPLAYVLGSTTAKDRG